MSLKSTSCVAHSEADLALSRSLAPLASHSLSSRRNAYKNKGIFGQDGQSSVQFATQYSIRAEAETRAISRNLCLNLFADLISCTWPTELRRRREEAQVEIRKQKREESVAKRRNFNAPSSGADSDEEGGADSSVSAGNPRLQREAADASECDRNNFQQ